ncbi:hypothetical protein CLU82_4166 [Flavobacterium sp. 5]|nr:hypothetical protein CLU82_4166 [Flavobacterium sp. 5]
MNYIKLHTILIATIFLTILSSCENTTDLEIKNQNNNLSDLEIQDGTIKLQNKTALKNILNSYKVNIENQNEFNNKIRKIQSEGFKPLTPIFDENDTENIQQFLARKKDRIQKRNLEFGLASKSSESDAEIEFDDELIPDPSFAALLNEDREIYVGDSLYKYTEMGMYFCLIKDQQKLNNYLNKLSSTSRKIQITNRPVPCPEIFMKSTTNKVISELTEVSTGIMLFIPAGNCGGGNDDSGIPIPPVPRLTFPTPPSPRLIKQNLEICTIQKQGFFEKIFGETESDEDYYDDNKRVKTSFWNQNYYIFSSIGCSVRFQKRVKILGISGWQKSYAEQIELGINNIQYDYKFNVPMFNNVLYVSGPTVYYEYKGVKYNQTGQVIPTLPTDNPGWPFSTDSNQNVVDIYIFNNDFTISDPQANKLFDQGLRVIANSLSNLNPAKAELQKSLDSENLKYNILKAVPFSNKVTFATMGVKWTNNDDNAITHYFDSNFLLTWKSDYKDTADYLKGLKGSTAYSNVTADIYAAALHNGQWKGRRLVTDKIK